MKEFFKNLKEIREKKKITLEEISKRSRLSLQILQDIEAGNLNKLPKGYDRILFKRYLKEIGEDKEEVWKDFNLFFGSGPLKEHDNSSEKKIPETDAQVGKTIASTSPREDKEKTSFWKELPFRLNLDRIHRNFWISVTVIVVGIVTYLAYQQFLFVEKSQVPIKEITVSDFISRMQKEDSLSTPTMKQSRVGIFNRFAEVNVELRAKHAGGLYQKNFCETHCAIHVRESRWSRDLVEWAQSRDTGKCRRDCPLSSTGC